MSKIIEITRAEGNSGSNNYYFSNLDAIYCHVPRCCGTFLKRFMYMRDQKLKEEDVDIDQGYIHAVLKYDRKHKSELIGIDTFIFTFIRDPLDRIMSAYRKFIVDDFAHFRTCWGFDKDTTFQDFVQSVANASDGIKGDIHLVSQYDLLTYNDKLFPSFIGLYDTFEDDMNYVCEKLKIKKPNYNIKINASNSDLLKNVDNKIKEILYERYKQDYYLIDTIRKYGKNYR